MNLSQRISRNARGVGGFTLIELMVTVVVIAILSAIALPIYRSHVLDSRRTLAQSTLTEATARQEQFFLNTKNFTTTIGAGGLAMDAATPDSSYTLSVAAPTAGCPITQCYVLQATPTGAQLEDSCGTLSLDSEGVKAPNGCW